MYIKILICKKRTQRNTPTDNLCIHVYIYIYIYLHIPSQNFQETPSSAPHSSQASGDDEKKILYAPWFFAPFGRAEGDFPWDSKNNM
jgi:hypothetical protein